jgi:uncharacterized delta-60 repeat protein
VRRARGCKEDPAEGLLRGTGRDVAVVRFTPDLDRPKLALARYTPDGRLDKSFGTTGKLILPLGEAEDIALQRDGRIIVAGGGAERFSLHVSIATERSTGASELTGPRCWGMPVQRLDVFVHRSGEIVATGSICVCPAELDEKWLSVVVRFKESGELDRRFGRGGRVETVAANALSLQPDGKLVLAGGLVKGRDDINFRGWFIVERRFAFPTTVVSSQPVRP